MHSVISKKVIAFRNVANYKFSHNLLQEQKNEIIAKLSDVLGKDYKLINLSTADENTVKNLLKNNLINSKSSLVFFNLKTNICIDLFNGEHLTISANTFANDNAFKKVKQVTDKLFNSLILSYSDTYGFLASNLYNIGSGYRIEADICLDSICALNKIEQVKHNVSNLGYSLVETNLKSTYKLSTKSCLGIAEEDLLTEFEKMMEKLQDLEIESAKMLDVSSHDEIYDKVMRSYAILTNCHLINHEELSTLLTIVRTGVNLGFIEISNNKLIELQALVLSTKNLISKTESKELAALVRNILKGE